MAQNIELQPGDVLLIIDLQDDFLPGGALAVASGDDVIDPLNQYISLFRQQDLPIFASRDWHPANHCSFKDQGGPWPPHCVADTPGAAFSKDLKLPTTAIIISKAAMPKQEAYSAFSGTTLLQQLTTLQCKRLFIGGLATDYCVKFSVQDALAAGFSVCLLVDAIKGIDPIQSAQIIEQFIAQGVIPVTFANVRTSVVR